MKSKILFLSLLASGLSSTLSAAAIFGTFDMSGSLTVTPTTITWTSDLLPGLTPNRFTLTAGTGSFAVENGQDTINNLNIAAQPVGSTFPPTQFISFTVVPGLPTLDINMIYPGTSNATNCTAPPAVGQTCTPSNVGGSPFTFTNTPPPTNIQSAAQFVFSGVTSDGLSSWFGVFTSQFNVPYQTVLAAFSPGGAGFVTNSYSATITVTPNPAVPEPGPMVLLASGVGLLLISLGLRKRRPVC